jgi:multicomponent Na+:H+ antiporter subunit A
MTPLFIVLFSPFVLASIAPWTVDRWPRLAPRAFSGAALLLTGVLIAQAPRVLGGSPVEFDVPWLAEFHVRFSLRLDALALLMSMLVTGVGAVVLQYASAYMEHYRSPGRFYLYLLSFMGAMLGIILAENLFLLFIFWELTGITSFLLIGFDHHRPSAREAALQALLLTGAGALAMLVGFILLSAAAGTASLSELAGLSAELANDEHYTAIVLLVMAGAFTKSAQFPFHFWLPAAMEAPSPVSAYLHSATMVKAGVYLLARMSPVLGGMALWNDTLMAVGMITMLVGALMGFAQTDMKRMLAYTTVSVLGLLVALIGIGTEASFKALMVFWVAHVFYKATLFLLTGAVDHEFGTRDIRRLGGLGKRAPLLAAAGLLAAFSMWGLPPLFGFIGKEAVYEVMMHPPGPRELAPAVASGLTVVAMVLMGAAGLLAGVRPFFGRQPPGTPGHEASGHGHSASSTLALSVGPLSLAVLGLAAGVFPGSLSTLLMTSAGDAFGGPVSGYVSLWHGFTPVLGLSVATLVLATTFVFLWPPLQPRLAVIFEAFALVGPLRLYDAMWSGLKWLTELQLRALSRVCLRHEVMLVIATLPILIGLTLWIVPGQALPEIRVTPVGVHEIILALVVLLSALVAIYAQSLPGAIAGLGGAGYGVALLYARFGGPDLAMTQFAVETLTVILFVLVIYRLPKPARYTKLPDRITSAIVAGVFGVVIGMLTLFSSFSVAGSRVSGEYVARSLTEAKGRNIVNVILVDFRALDTLGEITVLGTAALGIYALMKLRPRKDQGA